jgi:hypothetical protein
MQSEVLTAVKMSMFILWVVILCGLVGRSPWFGETYCFHLQSWWRRQLLPIVIHTISTNVLITPLAASRTSYLNILTLEENHSYHSWTLNIYLACCYLQIMIIVPDSASKTCLLQWDYYIPEGYLLLNSC